MYWLRWYDRDIEKIFGILTSLIGLILFCYGIIGLIKFFKDSTRSRKYLSTRIGEYGIFIYCGLNVLLLIYLLVFYGHSAPEWFTAPVFSVAGVIICLIIKIKHKNVCSNCNNKLQEKDIFCSKCGKKIVEEETDKTIETK